MQDLISDLPATLAAIAALIAALRTPKSLTDKIEQMEEKIDQGFAQMQTHINDRRTHRGR